MIRDVRHSEPAIAKANGIELVYDTFGDSDAPPLLLIMGLASQMIAWDDDFCGMLAARGYQVIRFDNRDIGLSTKCSQFGVPDLATLMAQSMAGQPVIAPYTLRDMADDTVGLLDALGISTAHVAGASMGGAIAQEVAIRHPHRLRTLTSIMATSGDPALPPPKPEAMAALFAPTPTDLDGYIERYRRTWQVLRGPGSPLDEARDAERARQIHARGLNPPGVARQFAAILASGSRKQLLESIGIPTLVIHGDADPLVPVECGIDVANTVPDAKLLIIEGMGHALPISMWPRIVDGIAEHAARTEVKPPMGPIIPSPQWYPGQRRRTMTVKFEMDGPLAIATISDPPTNLLTAESLTDLEAAMEKALEAKARAFLTLAEGDHFCRGANVPENFLGKNANDGRRLLNQGVSFIQRFERLPIPTVVAIRGLCLGGGCEIAQVHDIIFAGESARLGQIEALIGTTTLLGGASRLVARVGLARAKEMVFSAGNYDAKTMLEWGLVNHIFPDAEVEARARAYAMKLANGPTVAFGISKALINMTVNNGVSAADALVVEAAAQTFDTKDMQTAVRRYAEGGPEALFKGMSFKGE